MGWRLGGLGSGGPLQDIPWFEGGYSKMVGLDILERKLRSQ
jgi:hypothetical protein